MNPKKEMHEAKARYAEKVAADNRRHAVNSGLTDQQCDALDSMCRARHDMHSNTSSIIKGESSEYLDRVIRANRELEDSGLTPVPTIPTDTVNIDMLDIDTIWILEEIGEAPKDDDYDTQEDYEKAYQDWYDTEYTRISHDLEALNEKIESYLATIDKKHGTHYAPTGWARMK